MEVRSMGPFPPVKQRRGRFPDAPPAGADARDRLEGVTDADALGIVAF
jgi:hypothetical protein